VGQGAHGAVETVLEHKAMKLTEKAEEFLETLWIELVEGGKADCDITLVKEDEALALLGSRGLVKLTDNRAALTEKGRGEAAGCVRRHRLAERLLADVLHVKPKFLDERSCSFEHLLHEGLDDSICTLLGHPRACPHGRPIPEGPCCREARKQTGKLILPLAELEPGKHADIAYLHTHDKAALQKLIAMGALPKTDIVILQRRPTLVFQIGRSQFAIDDELAAHVFVRRK
jgi:DtxR family transcriptional regulator, Mn-dependent transcriptional regulator